MKLLSISALMSALTMARSFSARPCLVCDAHQATYVRERYRDLRRWYEENAASSAVPENIGHWNVGYEEYVNGFVAEIADGLELQPGDAVFESAVGAGWLLRGLRERLPHDVSVSLRLAGNDIIPMALDFAERGLHSDVAPPPVLCLGDSANLTTWVPHAAFDAVLCGYIEPNAGGLEWVGKWVAQMAHCAKPGALIFVGNNPMPLANPRPGRAAGGTPSSWWEEAAASDKFGWSIAPESVRIAPLRSPLLREKWGERYAVFMRKRGTDLAEDELRTRG